MMKIVIAPDSFKGSLSAPEAARAMARGARRAASDAEIRLCPMADGGEGTTDALVHACGGRKAAFTVTGPVGAPVNAEIGLLGEGEVCVLEMASASGLPLVPPDRLDPLSATTFGTGELIRHALDLGCRHFIIGLGGSATNDGGAGMLQALGLRLLDAAGDPVGFGGGRLGEIRRVDRTHWDPRLSQCTFVVASDVDNPLIGPRGASRVFGPQKGADAETVRVLDENLKIWADLILQDTGVATHELPGAGAGGGIGAALAAYLSADFRRGVDLVMEKTGLRHALAGCDLLITGEGKVDVQTAFGKAPMGVAGEAAKRGVPVIALAGQIGEGIAELYGCGITAVHSIVDRPMRLEDALREAGTLLERRAEQIVRTFAAGRKRP